MSYTQDQLEKMPLGILRNLDIQTQEEERMVQEVVNQKLANLPVDVDLTITSSMTDNLTPETEAELQRQIDAERAAKISALLPHKEVIIESEGTNPPGIDPETISGTNPEPIVSEPVTATNKFCQFCDSKGVRHKKDCTRPINEKHE